MGPVPTIEENLATIGELWLGEGGTGLTFTYEPGSSSWNPPSFIVSLTWASELRTFHHADFTEHVWCFYGDTVAEAFSLATTWVAELAALKEPDE